MQQMTQAFTTADIGKKKIKAVIKQAGQLINLHLDKSGTKFSSKLQYKELYLVTAVLLIGFLHETDKMTEEETVGLRNLLFNARYSLICLRGLAPAKHRIVSRQRNGCAVASKEKDWRIARTVTGAGIVSVRMAPILLYDC